MVPPAAPTSRRGHRQCHVSSSKTRPHHPADLVPSNCNRVTRFEVALRYRFVAMVFERYHLHLKPLLSDPGLAFIAITFVKVWHFRMGENPVFVAHNWRCFDQLYFFGHDFVLTATAAY